jgi:cell division protease FtsH
MLEHAAIDQSNNCSKRTKFRAAWYLPEERLIVRPDQMLDENVPWEEELRKSNFQQNFNRSIKRFRKVTKQARAMVTVYGLNEN